MTEARKECLGKKYGRLLVISFNEEVTKSHNNKHIYYNCECDCGNKTIVTKEGLKSGNTKSCGCLQREFAKSAFITHGATVNRENPRLYRIWKNMKNRCNNPNGQDYKYYGGRGITVCSEWNYDYDTFKKWALSSGYENTLTIDRIDTDGNYEPSNCRWSTRKEQANNMRSNHIIVYNNKEYTMTEFAEEYNICYGYLKRALKEKTIDEFMLKYKPRPQSRKV